MSEVKYGLDCFRSREAFWVAFCKFKLDFERDSGLSFGIGMRPVLDYIKARNLVAAESFEGRTNTMLVLFDESRTMVDSKSLSVRLAVDGTIDLADSSAIIECWLYKPTIDLVTAKAIVAPMSNRRNEGIAQNSRQLIMLIRVAEFVSRCLDLPLKYSLTGLTGVV